MNISIYYLSKKIILTTQKQVADNQLFKNLDELKKKEVFDEFEKFINQNQHQTLFLVCSDIEMALDKLKKVFKLIYAAGGLIQKDDAYLFIFRLKKWDLPKGKIDMGESPEEAAIRECEEECGITKLTITKILEPTYHIYEHKGGYALKKTFWYAMSTEHSGNLVPQLEENIEQVVWYNKTQITNTVITNTYPAILDVIKIIP